MSHPAMVDTTVRISVGDQQLDVSVGLPVLELSPDVDPVAVRHAVADRFTAAFVEPLRPHFGEDVGRVARRVGDELGYLYERQTREEAGR